MRSIKATQNSWGLVAKIFHWVLALLLIWQIFTGFNLHNMEFSPNKIGLIGIHKIIGTTIFTIVVFFNSVSDELITYSATESAFIPVAGCT